MPAQPDQICTLGELVDLGTREFESAELFFGHGTDNARDEAAWLAIDGLGLDHGTVMADDRLTPDQVAKVLRLFEQRVETRQPAAYLTGKAWFCGLPFEVDRNVLVPRSPIAELIERAYSPWADAGQVRSVLDLCTGGGCIAIATAVFMPDVHVTGSDISDAALAVARSNALTHGVEDHVEFVKSDVYLGLKGRVYDMIVSNPPYVSLAEMKTLPAEYHQEPEIGLEAGADGLEIVDRILDGAAAMLNPRGLLIVEVGNSRDQVEARYPQLALTWLEFERGGDGVFLIDREQLAEMHVG